MQIKQSRIKHHDQKYDGAKNQLISKNKNRKKGKRGSRQLQQSSSKLQTFQCYCHFCPDSSDIRETDSRDESNRHQTTEQPRVRTSFSFLCHLCKIETLYKHLYIINSSVEKNLCAYFFCQIYTAMHTCGSS